MIHNDVLRRLRYALSISNQQMIDIFKLSEYEINEESILKIMAKEDDSAFVLCSDQQLCLFLDGLIIAKRGKKEGQLPIPLPKHGRLTNNEILRKIRIALELKDIDVVSILELVDLRISKPELSSFSRRADHRNYKECGNQFLRNFLSGLTLRYKDKK